MPRNGSGVYVQPAGTAGVPNTTIQSTPYNALVADVGNEITGSLPISGVKAMAATLPMGGFRIINAGDPSGAQDAATKNYVDVTAKANPVFTGSITTPVVIGGTGTGSSLTLQSTSGVGATDFIDILVGNNGATRAGRFTTSGQFGLGTTAPTSRLTISNNAATLPTPPAGATIHVGGADSVQSRLVFDGFGPGGNGNFTFRAANGTNASRSALTTGTIIGSIAAFGAYDATNYTTTGRATITYNAAENWSVTNQGTSLQFFTTLNGAVAQRVVATLGNDASFTLVGLLDLSGAAAGQIKFPSTQNPSADPNTFDDYAEGTFTPTVIGTGTAGAGTYSVQTGHYVKTAARVAFDINLTWSAHTGTTNMKLSGLPFTAGARKSPVALQCDSLTFAATLLQGFVEASATTINLGTVATGAAYTALPIDTAATLCVTGSYSVV